MQVGAWLQTWLVVSHLSRVQLLLSSQSVSKAQQPVLWVLAQVPSAVLQVSVVQGLLSLQLSSVEQQAAIG